MKTTQEKNSLRQKLREKMKQQKLGRTSQVSRDSRMEKLQKKFDTASDEEKIKIKGEIELLNSIEEKFSNFSGEFPEYNDNSAYGGGLECSD